MAAVDEGTPPVPPPGPPPAPPPGPPPGPPPADTLTAENKSPYLNVVVEGCCHGALDEIYASVKQIEKRRGVKVDLLICCGDFQALRNEEDFDSLAVPDKFKKMESFHKYYSGVSKAPVLTIVIGGNHEASNHMLELFHGGWLAPNIYYLGAAGVVSVGGVRIAGCSGIYKSNDYLKGFHEDPTCLNPGTVRSAYHTRQSQVFQLSQLSNVEQPSTLDVMLSHDWPTGVVQFGDKKRLLKNKPFFKDEVESNTLGSPPYEQLMHQIKPNYWFSGHLHCKFAAIVPHRQSESKLGDSPSSSTRFLALDKCMPRRDFLQLVTLPRPETEVVESGGESLTEWEEVKLKYDPTWLAIMQTTHNLLSCQRGNVYMPSSMSPITAKQLDEVTDLVIKANGSLEIPENFQATAHSYPERKTSQHVGNPQTDTLLAMLGLNHVVTKPYAAEGRLTASSSNTYGSSFGGGGGKGVSSFLPRPPLPTSSITYLVPVQARSATQQLNNFHLSNQAAQEDENEIDIDDIENADENEIDIDDIENADENEIDIDNIENADENEIDIDNIENADENEIDIDNIDREEDGDKDDNQIDIDDVDDE